MCSMQYYTAGCCWNSAMQPRHSGQSGGATAALPPCPSSVLARCRAHSRHSAWRQGEMTTSLRLSRHTGQPAGRSKCSTTLWEADSEGGVQEETPTQAGRWCDIKGLSGSLVKHACIV